MKPLVISNFNKGKSNSPYTGFYEMRNVNIHKQEGSIQLSYLPKAPTDTTICNGIPTDKAYSPSDSRLYQVLSSGRVVLTNIGGTSFSELAGNTLTNASGNGIAYWKGHIFVARNQAIDVYRIASGQWFNDWMSLNFGYEHPFFHCVENDNLYIGDGKYVAMVEENAGQIFSASNSATYTQSGNVLDLPSNYIISKIGAVGYFLMFGTRMINQKKAYIFPYNLQTLTSTFESPMRIEEYGVTAMANDGDTLYVACGNEGNIYVTNSTSFKKYGTVPGEFNDNFNGTVWVYDLVFNQGRLLCAVGIGNTTVRGAGVYSFNGKSWCVDFSPSTLSDGSSSIVNIRTLFPYGTDSIYIGYQDGTNYAIELAGGATGTRYTNYSGYVETELFDIESKPYDTAQYQTGQIVLGKKMSTGNGIRIKYRNNLTDSFSTIGTYDYATYGAVAKVPITVPIFDSNQTQFRIELNSTDTTSPELKYIIFA